MTAKIVKLNSIERSVILFVLRDEGNDSQPYDAGSVAVNGARHRAHLRVVYKA